jgi:type VI protein secretion system component VasF
MSRTLAEICEPIFQYACRLSRASRKGAAAGGAGGAGGGGPETAQVSAELTGLLQSARAEAAKAGKAEAFDRVEIVLMYFLDSMVRQSSLPIAKSWPGLAAAKGKPGGDEEFFDELDETLRDSSPGAVDRLGVFYACLGLGFTGWYTGQHDFLRKKMQEIASRLRGQIDADVSARLCPDAYQSVNTSDLVQPASRSVAGVAVALVGLGITLVIVNIAIYLDARRQMGGALEKIVQTSAPDAPGGGR